MMTRRKLRVGLVVPHIFIHQDILPHVIFSPGELALLLCEKLSEYNIDVTLYTPGPAATTRPNETADLSLFQAELDRRDDNFLSLLKKHPFTFVTLSRQVQSEITAKAYHDANEGKLDVVHIYTNEEELALPFSRLCKKPVIFTHHDPFNFLIRYKSVFPKYSTLNWLALSSAQREGMPPDTNWVDTIYHGVDGQIFQPITNPSGDYAAYFGRIIEPKGVHLAIEAVKQYNSKAAKPITLKIAGKHYADHKNDSYWSKKVEPELGGVIEYIGHIKDPEQKRDFLGNAKVLFVPSTFNEPFGMVTIESLAMGTPVIGLQHGATKEIIKDGENGFIISHDTDAQAVTDMALALSSIPAISRKTCRKSFEDRFTLSAMVSAHAKLYQKLAI